MAENVIRIWRGWTRRSDADAYERFLRTTCFKAYTSVDGNRAVHMTRRELGDNTEFCVISHWNSWEAIEIYAGEQAEEPMYHPEEERFLLGEHTITHYRIFAST